MNRHRIKKYISILLLIALPILGGYIASIRGENPITWSIRTFFFCGVFEIIVSVLLQKRIGLDNHKMDTISKHKIQSDIDRSQMQSIEQMNNTNQISDYSRMN